MAAPAWSTTAPRRPTPERLRRTELVGHLRDAAGEAEKVSLERSYAGARGARERRDVAPAKVCLDDAHLRVELRLARLEAHPELLDVRLRALELVEADLLFGRELRLTRSRAPARARSAGGRASDGTLVGLAQLRLEPVDADALCIEQPLELLHPLFAPCEVGGPVLDRPDELLDPFGELVVGFVSGRFRAVRQT